MKGEAKALNGERGTELPAAETGAIAHLYRAEVYRSTVWRTRLDTTTNWAVVTLGVALSLTFASRDSSEVPLILVGLLTLLFLLLESRRYRYFNVSFARCRWMESHFYAAMLSGEREPEGWREMMARDLRHPAYHISLMTAIGRRVRRNYLWIMMIQSAAWAGKILIHPTPAASVEEFLDRAAVGAFPGALVLAAGLAYLGIFAAIAFWSKVSDGGRDADDAGSSLMA